MAADARVRELEAQLEAANLKLKEADEKIKEQERYIASQVRTAQSGTGAISFSGPRRRTALRAAMRQRVRLHEGSDTGCMPPGQETEKKLVVSLMYELAEDLHRTKEQPHRTSLWCHRNPRARRERAPVCRCCSARASISRRSSRGSPAAATSSPQPAQECQPE